MLWCPKFSANIRIKAVNLFCGGYMLYDWMHCWNGGLWNTPDSKVHGATMGPIWGQQDPGGPHVGPMNLAIWDTQYTEFTIDIWKQLSFQTHELKNNFLNMNKEGKMTSSFLFGGHLINLYVICAKFVCQQKPWIYPIKYPLHFVVLHFVLVI